jgi:hypothetical protein
MRTLVVVAMVAAAAMAAPAVLAQAGAPQAVKAAAAKPGPVRSAPARAPVKPDAAEAREPSKRSKAQQEAMKALSFLDGEWRGASKTLRKTGWVPMVQTERTGTMLDGTVRVIEVRGYETDGRLSFNALRIISYDPDSKTYSMRSYQNGNERDYKLATTANSIAWEIAGKESTTRYETSVRNGVWSEKATRMPANGEPETYLSITMKRMRESAWPRAGALLAK